MTAKICCMSTELPRIGKEIRGRLKEIGWSQQELANRANLTQGAISKLVRGKTVPTPETLSAISYALGLDPLYLMRLAGIPLPKEKSKRKPAIEHIAQRLDSLPPQVQDSAIASLGAQIDALENAVLLVQTKEKPTPHDTQLNGYDPGVEEIEPLRANDTVEERARKFTKIVREFQFLFPDEYEKVRQVLGLGSVAELV